MKILYNVADGKIIYAIPDKDYFFFTHSTNISLTEFTVDELAPDNRALCIDLKNTVGKVDTALEPKYIVMDDVLQEKEGWSEGVRDV